MYIKSFILLLFLCCFACNKASEEQPDEVIIETKTEFKFDKVKWRSKDDKDYPYRDQMVDDILYNEAVRALKKDGVIELLGAPDRYNDGHLYYQISQKRIGSWPLKTKTLVIKLSEDESIEWIKLHG